ncbi:MAG: hypothetical protein EOM20_19985, partial [Spartobacteria bacterium]|nr:hypothetical protein [Spartobacteria bacterium]
MKNGMVVSKMLKFWLVLAIICTGGAYAHAAGLVDDFDGGADPLFAGTYAVYGEDALGQDASQVTTLRAHSTSHSRFMEQTLNGSQAWGIVLIKSFTSLVDASAYDGGTLDVWFYSDSNNSVLTLDVNLVFSVADGGDGISDYSLKTALEPSLASAYGQWIKLSIPLTTASFDVENFGAFDLSSLSQIKFLIKNNGQPKPAAKIYLDDIQFTGSADSTPPTISYTAPSTGGEVFPTTTPTINGLLSDDDSGIDTASLAISIDGVPQSGAMVLPESFSFTVASPLADAVTHTSVVVVSDNAGNTQTATTTFAVNSSLVQEDLLNPGFEYGDGVSLANWGKFGDAAQAFDGPRSGSAHGRLLGNYPGNNSQNYSGFYQTLPAAPGDIWSAGVYAQVAQALGANNEALLQLIYVNGAGETVPGGVNDSAAKLTAATPVGTYAQLTASGQAPAGTEGVKVVLLLIQRNEGAGLVYFDDASIQKQTLPSGPALPANTLVDDFSSVTLYHSQHVNDLGYYTDDDATLAVESVTNGMLTAQWSGDAYWYTLLAPNDGSASLTNNTYLSMRYRGHSGGETFNITLREAGGMTATIACDPIVGVQAHTVNYPLSDFAALALNIQDIRTLSLGFAAATPGTISIDGIGLSAYARPDSINLVAPSMVTGSVPFSAQVTVSDASGVMTDFSGTLNLRVSEGTVSPATVSNFVNGVATVNIVVDGALNTVLYAEDELGAAGSEALTVDTVLPPPSLSNPGFEEGEGPVPYSWEAFGERMRDAATPYVGSYAGRLTGN